MVRFAYWIGGPIDFVVNGLVNVMVAQILFGCVQEVPLTGRHSALLVTGPMLFIMPLATTVFGFQNGMIQRRLGDYGSPWVPGTRWLGPAIRVGLLRALILGGLGCFTLLLWNSLSGGDYHLSRNTYVWLHGLLAGSLGYVLHARAILLAGRL